MSTPTVISQAKAEALGLKRYRTGVPCVGRHRAERYFRGRACVECNKHAVPRNLVARDRPSKATAAVEVEVAPVEEAKRPEWRDPGRRIGQARVDAFIEQVFNSGPRVTVSEAA